MAFFIYFSSMNLSAGKILVTTSKMDDPKFKDSIVFIAEHNEAGAIGLVINKLFERPLNALAEFSQCPDFPLYAGGPVDREHLFFIHRRPDLIPGGTPASNGIYYGGDFAQAIANINQHSLDEAGIKICIGYCGWDKGELEAEIEEGSWRLEECSPDIIFVKDPALFLER